MDLRISSPCLHLKLLLPCSDGHCRRGLGMSCRLKGLCCLPRAAWHSCFSVAKTPQQMLGGCHVCPGSSQRMDALLCNVDSCICPDPEFCGWHDLTSEECCEMCRPFQEKCGDWQGGAEGRFFPCCLKHSCIKCKFSLLKASLIRLALVLFFVWFIFALVIFVEF